MSAACSLSVVCLIVCCLLFAVWYASSVCCLWSGVWLRERCLVFVDGCVIWCVFAAVCLAFAVWYSLFVVGRLVRVACLFNSSACTVFVV